MQDETLIIVAAVAALGLLVLILRPRRRAPLTLAIGDVQPRRPRASVSTRTSVPVRASLPVRASSLAQQIDAAFDELEIKPVRLVSINGAFDTSDVPLEVIDELTARRPAPAYAPAAAFGAEPTMDAATAFSPEPTVTVVDDNDGTSSVDELAAFLARATTWERAETARTPT